jgi:hypothetical protein
MKRVCKVEERVTIETIYQSLNYGKIVRLRGVQLWPGEDERGRYLDIHIVGTLAHNQVEVLERSNACQPVFETA